MQGNGWRRQVDQLCNSATSRKEVELQEIRETASFCPNCWDIKQEGYVLLVITKLVYDFFLNGRKNPKSSSLHKAEKKKVRSGLH